MFPALDISSSGLAAQRIRMNARSSNIANVSTTHNEAGERDPYRAKYVIFQTEPDNVDMVIEFTDALEAARSYEANLGAIEITKDMTNQTLRILA